MGLATFGLLSASFCLGCVRTQRQKSVNAVVVKMSDDLRLEYSFDEKPKLGTSIIKVQLFDKNDNKLTHLKIFLSSGMPSMAKAHDTVWQELLQNKRGDYLLPVNFVMPGGWALNLKVMDANKVLCQGAIDVQI
jgi:hypothetical protein